MTNCGYCGGSLGAQGIEHIGMNAWFCSRVCADKAKESYGLKTKALHQEGILKSPEILRELSQGVKYDQNKLPYHLISISAMDELAKRLQHGAQKYSDRNWEKGLEYNRCYRAALNHLYAFWRGEDIDADSGLSHLSGALCNLMFLCHFESDPFYKQFDNRPVAPGKSKLQ